MRASRFLDAKHLLIAGDRALHIYPISYELSAEVAPFVPASELDDYLCKLHFPAIASNAMSTLRTLSVRHPSPNLDHQALFAHDASRTIYAVLVDVNNSHASLTQLDRDRVSFLYLIPMSTLLTRAQSAARDVKERDVPWENWGPRRTQVIRAWKPCRSISLFGSKCAMVFARNLGNQRSGCLWFKFFLAQIQGKTQKTRM